MMSLSLALLLIGFGIVLMATAPKKKEEEFADKAYSNFRLICFMLLGLLASIISEVM